MCMMSVGVHEVSEEIEDFTYWWGLVPTEACRQWDLSVKCWHSLTGVFLRTDLKICTNTHTFRNQLNKIK